MVQDTTSSFKYRIAVLLSALLLVCLSVDGMNRFPKRVKREPPTPPKFPRVNVDILPNLLTFLEENHLTPYLQKFIRLGVTESQHLLRLNDMDFRIMLMDWDIEEKMVTSLREKIAGLLEMARLPDEEESGVNYEERNKLRYGRIYLPGGVQSLEYVSASFGGPPPVGPRRVVMGIPEHGCNISAAFAEKDIAGSMYVIRRGDCTFLTKALAAHAAKVAVLVVINSDDQLESPSSGLGVDKSIVESTVLALNDMSVVSLTNATYDTFSYAVKYAPPGGLMASIVPLKCVPGGKCLPVVPEEKSMQPEVSAGLLEATTSSGDHQSFEFLTSTFGGTLPSSPFRVVSADSILGCEPLEQNPVYSDAAVLVHRGHCRFDAKAKNVQDAGGRLLIVVETDDNALQRIGGYQPEAGHIGIPGILVTAPCGKFLETSLSRGDSVTLSLKPYVTNEVTDQWIELAYMEWPEGDQEKLMQIEGLVQKYLQLNMKEIVAWLQRSADRIRAAKGHEEL